MKKLFVLIAAACMTCTAAFAHGKASDGHHRFF